MFSTFPNELGVLFVKNLFFILSRLRPVSSWVLGISNIGSNLYQLSLVPRPLVPRSLDPRILVSQNAGIPEFWDRRILGWWVVDSGRAVIGGNRGVMGGNGR